MRDDQFWKAIGVLTVAGLFYVGAGLRQRSASLPLLEQSAHASQVQVDPRYSPWTDGSAPVAVTSSADGQTLYFWGSALQPKVPGPQAKLSVQATATASGLQQMPEGRAVPDTPALHAPAPQMPPSSHR